MSDFLTKRPISNDEASAALRRFIDGHFRNKGEGPRIGIPARPDYDDDLVLCAYIEQQAARDACTNCGTPRADQVHCPGCDLTRSEAEARNA